VLEPESSEKFSEKIVVWASVVNVPRSMRAATVRRIGTKHNLSASRSFEQQDMNVPKREEKILDKGIPFQGDDGKVSGTAIRLVSFSRLQERYGMEVRVVLRKQNSG